MAFTNLLLLGLKLRLSYTLNIPPQSVFKSHMKGGIMSSFINEKIHVKIGPIQLYSLTEKLLYPYSVLQSSVWPSYQWDEMWRSGSGQHRLSGRFLCGLGPTGWPCSAEASQKLAGMLAVLDWWRGRGQRSWNELLQQPHVDMSRDHFHTVVSETAPRPPPRPRVSPMD